MIKLAKRQAAFDAYRYHLTERETEVWQLSLQGCSYEQMARTLYISINAVRKHMKNIYSKQK